MADMDIDGIRFSHGKKEILKGIDFRMCKGEVIGILGQNGSGKTTLLNCINTEYRPDEGKVSVKDFLIEAIDSGHDVGDSVDIRELDDGERSRIVATVEQQSQMNFPFTVLETVRMGRYSRTGMFNEEDEDREMDLLCDIMEDVGILEFAERNASELSGGEWRRVMIAQALAQEPEILLLDEPTLHLDVNHQFGLMDLCRKISRERGILVVIVTHDLQLAARYCDRSIVIVSGRIVASGRTEEVITKDLIRDVFKMEARVEYDGEIHGLLVTLLRRIS